MKKHIVFYAVAFFIGCLSSICYISNIYIGAVIAASFLYIIFIYEDKTFFVIMLAFFLCGVFRFNSYFNYSPKKEERIRIVDHRENYIIGNVKGRRVIIKGEIEGLTEGLSIMAKGEYKKDINYDKGIIGSYEIHKYKNKKGDLIYKFAERKRKVIKKLEKYLDKDKLALVTSLCFGDVSLMDNIEKYKLQKLGVIHAVSVSGFHISIVYKFVHMILGFKLALIFIMLYVIFTGFKYSTLRAFIMILILSFSDKVYKNYDGISALATAFLVILFGKPYSFMEMGFSLSFLATLGIILHYGNIKSTLKSIPEKLRDTLSITLSSQIFTLPYIAFTIKNFSLGFLLGNVFLVPIFSLIVILGNLSILTTKIDFLFKIISYVLYYLSYIVEYTSYLLIKICPPFSYLGWYEGIYFMIVYFSYIMIKRGVVKFKALPLMSFLLIFINTYSLFPSVYFIDNQYVNGAIIRYNNECVMVCNYDLQKGKEVIKIKENFNATRVITDVKDSDYIYIRNYKTNILFEENEVSSIKLSRKNKTFLVIPEKERDYWYKIIFGRVIKWRR
ncbi:ComEC/Rec2 family competence protein [uncultured Clostridium sp.]|uniref:ComEC/Rec2 family competence protein n=1 Tax=uncultured Clostridium sp. TaxID=59620 RepID=UPI0028E2F224|nr:ComEC/Rec2 family competence protein [uncultured Clostridium sp.]